MDTNQESSFIQRYKLISESEFLSLYPLYAFLIPVLISVRMRCGHRPENTTIPAKDSITALHSARAAIAAKPAPSTASPAAIVALAPAAGTAGVEEKPTAMPLMVVAIAGTARVVAGVGAPEANGTLVAELASVHAGVGLLVA